MSISLSNITKTRKQKAAVSAGVSAVSAVSTGLLTFVLRAAMVYVLGAKYLGLYSLLNEVVGMLAFADLGIGVAMNYSLYNPIATKNWSLLKSLADMYRKVYMIVGSAIIVLGIALAPFLPMLIKGGVPLDEVYPIYVLFVINASSSYFLIGKRPILNADQRQYIVEGWTGSISVVCQLMQIALLFIWGDLLGTCILQLVSTIAINIILMSKAHKHYHHINSHEKIKISETIKSKIFKNSIGAAINNAQSVIAYGTDAIFISYFVNVVEVGLYANYKIIEAFIERMARKAVSAITAGIGNAAVSWNAEKSHEMFKKISFLMFFSGIVISSVLSVAFKPLITLWVGERFLLSDLIALSFATFLFFRLIGIALEVFEGGYGLQWNVVGSKIIAIALNLAFSFIFLAGLKMGVEGVILANLLGYLLAPQWYYPMVLYNEVFKTSLLAYAKIFFLYVLQFALAMGLTWFTISKIAFSNAFLQLFINSLIAASISLFIVIAFNFKRPEFVFLLDTLKKVGYRLIRK
jgi:O-antigen/teichoic acid export membrane protein